MQSSLANSSPDMGKLTSSMKSLLKLFKRKAKTALRRNEPTRETITSPFERPLNEPRSRHSESEASRTTKLTDHHSNATTAENPLADLARRVSSSELNCLDTTSSAFIGLKTSLDENWRVSTYKRSNSDGMCSSHANKHQSEAFEFIVPRPVSVEESEELQSTLFKWGTLETSKSKDSDRDGDSPGLHYSSWQKGQRTPFDPVSRKPMLPFNQRSDSAISEYCQEIGSFQLCKEVLTLSQLRKAAKKAKGGTILDLRGTTIKGEGLLIVSSPETTIQNGTIELSEGILVKAPGVALIDIRLSSQSSQSAAVSIVKRNCFIDRCTITNPEGSGVQVSGICSSLTIRRTTVFDCERNCVYVSRGGKLQMNDGCIIRGSRSFHGISASDKDTQITLQDSKIHDNCQDGIFVTQGVRAIVESCEIFGSKEFHGISGKKCGTSINLTNCKIHGNQESAVIIEQGAKAQLKDCSIRCSRNGHGIVAGSRGSHLSVTDSEVDNCSAGGILIFGSASSEIVRTHVHDSLNGNGIVISGSGSSTSLINSVVFCNVRNNILIENGGQVSVEDCDIFSSVRCNGILVRDKGSSAVLSRCNILKNQGCNIGVDAGATCSMSDCRVDDAVVGPNLIGRGRHTSIDAFATGSSANILRCSIVALKGASVKLNEQKARFRKSWNGLKLSSFFVCKVAYPST
eukprot:g7774.t1